MVYSTTLFHSFTKLSSNSHVKLPNGSFANVTHIGSVALTRDLHFTDVLCVLCFVSFFFPLASSLVLYLVPSHFFPDIFIFQDLASKIGLGKE